MALRFCLIASIDLFIYSYWSSGEKKRFLTLNVKSPHELLFWKPLPETPWRVSACSLQQQVAPSSSLSSSSSSSTTTTTATGSVNWTPVLLETMHRLLLVFVAAAGASVLGLPRQDASRAAGPCLAPLQWEGRWVLYDHSTGRNSRAAVSYDGQNQRIRVLQQNKKHTPCQK